MMIPILEARKTVMRLGEYGRWYYVQGHVYATYFLDVKKPEPYVLPDAAGDVNREEK